MGEETIQFASRFSNAVSQLSLIGGDATTDALRKRLGRALDAAVRDALEAVEAVYGTGTEAVRDWPEQRRRVLAELAKMRAALDRTGVDRELRRMARALVELIESGAARE